MALVRLPSKQFRSLPSPSGSSKVGMFYVAAESVPDALWEWREVNPREVNQRSGVYKAIAQTLTQDPERFHERNRGLTIVADDLNYDEKKHDVVLKLNDIRLNGVVDGAHTLHAILEAQKQPPEGDWPAHVFIKVFVGVEPDQIAEIAGGLNTSQQVDLKSLENLREHFEELQRAVEREPYASSIAYKMNEDKPIDVREVLYYLAVFDCTAYDEKKHPVALFGRKEGIVRTFAKQAADHSAGDSFRILITKAPEILRLRDLIEKRALAYNVGRYKTGRDTRVRSASNRGNLLPFINESVDGKIPLGWVMPLLAGFRANVKWDRPKGTFSWIVPIDELLARAIEQLVLGIQDVHAQENSRPEYVGRNSIAWRMSYSTVSQAILEWELKQARRKRA
jgi:hypothetical protein